MASIGEIRIFAFGFEPRGWLHCDGRILVIAEYAALFSMLGRAFTDPKTDARKFQLPDMRETAVAHSGQVAGDGFVINFGQRLGTKEESLTSQMLPEHRHGFAAYANVKPSLAMQHLTATPLGGLSRLTGCADQPLDTATSYKRWMPFAATVKPTKKMSDRLISSVGNGQPHINMSPYLTLNHCICVEGSFPRFD